MAAFVNQKKDQQRQQGLASQQSTSHSPLLAHLQQPTANVTIQHNTNNMGSGSGTTSHIPNQLPGQQRPNGEQDEPLSAQEELSKFVDSL